MSRNPVFKRFDSNVRRGQYTGFSQANFQGPGNGSAPSGGFQGAGVDGSPYGYQAGSAVQNGRAMTLDDVMTKSLALFGILAVFGVFAWVATDRSMSSGGGTGAALWLGGAILTLVLGFAISMLRTISVPLILAYTVAEGVFVGAVSAFFNARYPGVVGEAVLGTLCVFAAMLLGYKSGVVRVTDRSRRIFMYALIGYTLFALINFVLVLTGVMHGFGVGGHGPLGIVISLIAVGLASYSLAVDFDSINAGVRAGVPEKTAWLMAYGLMVSVVWLYLELVRLLSRLRD